MPEGWDVIYGENGRQECLDFIEENWTDMRPKSLIEAMAADARQNGDGINDGGAERTPEKEMAEAK